MQGYKAKAKQNTERGYETGYDGTILISFYYYSLKSANS